MSHIYVSPASEDENIIQDDLIMRTDGNYCDLSVMKLLRERLGKDKKDGKYLEHYVSTYILMLTRFIFSKREWVFSVEKIDYASRLKPDIVIEHFAGRHSIPYVYIECKSQSGSRLEEALYQTVGHLQNSAHQHSISKYCLVQRGQEVMGFEYHTTEEESKDLLRRNIPSFYSCTSLTQNYRLKGDMQTATPLLPTQVGAKRLFRRYSPKKLKKTLKSQLATEIRRAAYKYEVPCVYNLKRHGEAISHMLKYMRDNLPRDGPDEEDYKKGFTIANPLTEYHSDIDAEGSDDDEEDPDDYYSSGSDGEISDDE